jgi:hypothetical protein
MGEGGRGGHVSEVGKVANPHKNKSRSGPKASTTWFAFTNIGGRMGASHSYLQIAIASPCWDDDNVDDEASFPPDDDDDGKMRTMSMMKPPSSLTMTTTTAKCWDEDNVNDEASFLPDDDDHNGKILG